MPFKAKNEIEPTTQCSVVQTGRRFQLPPPLASPPLPLAWLSYLTHLFSLVGAAVEWWVLERRRQEASWTTAVLFLPWRREQGVDKLSLKSQHCAASREIKTVCHPRRLFSGQPSQRMFVPSRKAGRAVSFSSLP